MRHHLRCFESEQAYREYKEGDDIWLPRVAFVPHVPTPINEITMQTPGRLIFHELGEHFVEICNGGEMHFTDKYDAENDVWYRATVDSSGNLNLDVPEGTAEVDIHGELIFINFPDDFEADLR